MHYGTPKEQCLSFIFDKCTSTGFLTVNFFFFIFMILWFCRKKCNKSSFVHFPDLMGLLLVAILIATLLRKKGLVEVSFFFFSLFCRGNEFYVEKLWKRIEEFRNWWVVWCRFVRFFLGFRVNPGLK